MKARRLVINIRFGSTHLQSSGHFPWLTFFHNPGHVETVLCWWRPRFARGEFRRQEGWRWFAIYSLLGWAPR